jgi:hypothetical protein
MISNKIKIHTIKAKVKIIRIKIEVAIKNHLNIQAQIDKNIKSISHHIFHINRERYLLNYH